MWYSVSIANARTQTRLRKHEVFTTLHHNKPFNLYVKICTEKILIICNEVNSFSIKGSVQRQYMKCILVEGFVAVNVESLLFYEVSQKANLFIFMYAKQKNLKRAYR